GAGSQRTARTNDVGGEGVEMGINVPLTVVLFAGPTVVRQSRRVGGAPAEGFPVGVHTDSPGVVISKVLARGKSAKRSSTLQRRHGRTGGQHDPAGIGVRSGEEVAPTITVTTIDTETVRRLHPPQGPP